jgi:hypothetical protein
MKREEKVKLNTPIDESGDHLGLQKLYLALAFASMKLGQIQYNKCPNLPPEEKDASAPPASMRTKRPT